MLQNYCLEVLITKLWQDIRAVQDPELIRLADALPQTVLKARADSTTRKYLGAYKRWAKWAESKEELSVFPVKTAHFALYLQHVGEATKSKAAVEEAVNAISWLQRLGGQEEVSRNSLIKSVVEGFQRQLAQPKRKKEPVTPDMLKEIVTSTIANPTLTQIRLSAICLLAYAGFLRFDELQKLRCCDVVFMGDRMEITITSSKTDQYRQGDRIPIARSSLSTCPVAMMEKYFKAAALDPRSTEHLFRPIVSTKKGESLRASGSLSYTRLREIVLEKLQSLGYDAQQFGLHSFRAGGATAAANAADLPERLFKRHGRWKSETAKDGYVKDSEENRLLVSKKIGI